jgi:Na+/H+ antiporter NhaD/arsenite permease-like protein
LAFLPFPFEFALFGATLLGVALFHQRTLTVALAGLAAILIYKLTVASFADGPGVAGLSAHVEHHWVELANLGLLLLGFAVLSRHFEQSNLPERAPDLLPNDWTGGLVLLALVFVMSAFLDNIAGALIGATIAAHVYRKRVHIGYLAAIVAASNAGGAGSVVGDTTTTMMWIAGKSPADVILAFVGSFVAFAVFAIPASRAQQRFAPILKHETGSVIIDWARVWIVVFMLACAVGANVAANLFTPDLSLAMPVIGLALWFAVLTASILRRPDWSVLPEAAKGTLFLLALVLAASFMPVGALPPPSVVSTFGLGFLSAVFDNIPLTALALAQGGYDWDFLAYAVGFGGSMIWFGSSAGIAVSNLFRKPSPLSPGFARRGGCRSHTLRGFWRCWSWWGGILKRRVCHPHPRKCGASPVSSRSRLLVLPDDRGQLAPFRNEASEIAHCQRDGTSRQPRTHKHACLNNVLRLHFAGIAELVEHQTKDRCKHHHRCANQKCSQACGAVFIE